MIRDISISLLYNSSDLVDSIVSIPRVSESKLQAVGHPDTTRIVLKWLKSTELFKGPLPKPRTRARGCMRGEGM